MYTKSCDDLAEVPLAYVKEQMVNTDNTVITLSAHLNIRQANGQQTESYASNLLLDKEVSADRLYEIKWSVREALAFVEHCFLIVLAGLLLRSTGVIKFTIFAMLARSLSPMQLERTR
jgi:hypothetical protein